MPKRSAPAGQIDGSGSIQKVVCGSGPAQARAASIEAKPKADPLSPSVAATSCDAPRANPLPPGNAASTGLATGTASRRSPAALDAGETGTQGGEGGGAVGCHGMPLPDVR